MDVRSPDAAPAEDPAATPLLRVNGLTKFYPASTGVFTRRHTITRAVDGVSFAVQHGETLGLVGETGCGKSTLANTLLRLEEPTSGEAIFEGRDIFVAARSELRMLRRKLQIVFQNPYSSLSPRMTIKDILAEPLRLHEPSLHRATRDAQVMDILDRVGLPLSALRRYPHEFSGGQRQRIGIARALILKPKMVILDEPLSALDVSVQAQIANLLVELRDEMDVSYILISHDLAVIRSLAHRVAVMYLGRIVELAPATQIYEQPQHPYTQALVSAAPRIEMGRDFLDRRVRLLGDPPSPSQVPTGCRFRTRCWLATDRCTEQDPELEPRIEPQHDVACHYPQMGSTGG